MATLLNAQSIPYLRYPALSPDGRTVCFSCKGDLWLVPVTGGEAKRLTVHPAEDVQPQFSPDGKYIAFSSDRYDNYDVYIIPVEGGEPKRVTWYSGRDMVTGWTPDGDTIIFHSPREFRYDIFKVSINGETPVDLTGGDFSDEYFGKISPDASKLIFNNGSGRYRWWKAGFKGNTNSDIWIIDRTQDTLALTQVVSVDGHDLWPIHNAKENAIYFVRNRDNEENIWKIDLALGAETQITNFSGDGVQWLNSDPQMEKLIFEQGQALWYLDPAQGEPRKIEVTLNTDNKTNFVKPFKYSSHVSEYALSPDGKLAVLDIRGEMFLIPTEEADYARQLTFTSAREKHPVFDADSRTVYYVSDRNGNYDVYSYDLTTNIETQITDTPENETKPLTSPDGKKLVFYRALDKIILYDLENKKESGVVSGLFTDLAVEPYLEYDFSPDSRYLTFTMNMPTYETNIFVTDFKSDPVNVSKFIDYNYRPRFSDDNKYIYFSSWHRQDNITRVHKIELKHEPFEFSEDKLDSLLTVEEKSDEEKKDKDDKDAEKGKAKKEELTEIDFTDIHKRITQAVNLTTNISTPGYTPDGKKILFIANLLGKAQVWSINTDPDDPDLTQLTTSGGGKDYLEISADSKYAYYLEGGTLMKLDISSKKPEKLNFTAEMEIDLKKENYQKFLETWWMFDQYYYDPNHHGVDWNAIRDKYYPLIGELETEEEFRNVISEMMGEIESSHIYIYPSSSGVNDQIESPFYGFLLDHDELEQNGNYRIAKVFPNTPAALAEPALMPGDYIIAINGQKLTASGNIYKIIAGLIGHKAVFSVAKKPDGKTIDIAVKGATYGEYIQHVYDNWVETRRALVDSLSGGRLAYMHIQRMYPDALQKFKMEIMNEMEGKEGAVIDVRHNGGGNIAVHLLGILIKEPYIYRTFADFPQTSENQYRSKALEKPSILLINNGSGSNSEIFAEGFRKLGLGKIVGTRTAGGVIGTASYNLIDGTRIRRPSWGCYSTDQENLELIPRYPDITVELNLKDEVEGRDPQLERAVKELLQEL